MIISDKDNAYWVEGCRADLKKGRRKRRTPTSFLFVFVFVFLTLFLFRLISCICICVFVNIQRKGEGSSSFHVLSYLHCVLNFICVHISSMIHEFVLVLVFCIFTKFVSVFLFLYFCISIYVTSGWMQIVGWVVSCVVSCQGKHPVALTRAGPPCFRDFYFQTRYICFNI